MNIKIKNIIVLFLALALLLSVCSCALKINRPQKPGDISDESSTDTEPSGADDYTFVENNFYQTVKKHLGNIGKKDYEGSSFMIASFAPELSDPDKCGAVMSRTVYDRNKMVEDFFNISIYTKEADADTIYTEVHNSNLSGDFYADTLVIPQYYISQFAASGDLSNILSLPFTDFSAGYNIKSGVEAGIAGTSGYAVAGWATIQPDKLPCVYFNRTLFDMSDMEYPYKCVKNGEWTWDKFFEYSQAAETLDCSSYGYQNTAVSLGDIIYVSCDNKFISSGEKNQALVAVEPDSTNEFSEIAYKLFNDPKKNGNSIEAISSFANNSSLFLIENLGTSKIICSSDAVWGVLPMPKKSTEQENYKSLASNTSAFFAVPAECKSPEKTSRIISALNAASLGYIVDAYVTDSMYYYLRDNASVEMVEKICYSTYYDMAYSVGTDDLTIANSTYFAIRNVYENNHDINFYINSFSARANNALSRLFAY